MSKKLLTDSEIISEIIKALGISANKFALKLGYKKSSAVYNIIYGNNNLSEVMRDAILRVYPNVRKEYIEHGIGQPLSHIEPKAKLTTVEEQLYLDLKLLIYRINKLETAQKVVDAKQDRIEEKLDKVLEILTNTNN